MCVHRVKRFSALIATIKNPTKQEWNDKKFFTPTLHLISLQSTVQWSWTLAFSHPTIEEHSRYFIPCIQLSHNATHASHAWSILITPQPFTYKCICHNSHPNKLHTLLMSPHLLHHTYVSVMSNSNEVVATYPQHTPLSMHNNMHYIRTQHYLLHSLACTCNNQKWDGGKACKWG